MTGQKPQRHSDSNGKKFIEGDSAPESENDEVDLDKECESINELVEEPDKNQETSDNTPKTETD